MKNILVPIGSSSNSINNLQYGIDLAAAFGANVYVVSVFQEFSKVGGLSKVNTLLKEETENRLNDVISKVDSKGVQIIAHPIKGDVLENINRVNKQIPIDLMILAPRSNSIKEGVYLGKTSGKLLKQTNIPLIVVPEGAKFTPPTNILMAFKNGNFENEETLDALIKIINKFDAKLNVLHVETPETTEEMVAVSQNLENLQTTYKRTENASTFQAVIEYFQTFEPDMICVIRRPRGFFKKLWEKNEIMKNEFYTSKPLLVLPINA